MKRYMNKCHFIGRLVKNPELVDVNGVKVVNLVMMTTRDHKNRTNGTNVNEKVYLNLEAWHTAAETIAENFRQNDWMWVVAEAKKDRNYRINEFGLVAYSDDTYDNQVAVVESQPPEAA